MAVGRQTYTNDGGGKKTTSSTNPYIAQRQSNTSTGTANNNAQGKALTGYQAQRQYETSTGTAPRVNLPTAGSSANKGASSFGNASTKWGEGSGVVNKDLLPYKLGTTNNTPSAPSGGYYGNGGGSSDGGGGGGVDVGGSYHNETEDIITMIKNLLNQQKEQADNYYKALYEQTTAKNKQVWGNNRDKINVNYKRGERFLNNLYGNGVTGQGLSNRARNYQNWQSNLAENERNYANNDATALANYNMNKANTASQLAQGWYNYVLPVYTNRQQTLDDYDYRKYLASL